MYQTGDICFFCKLTMTVGYHNLPVQNAKNSYHFTEYINICAQNFDINRIIDETLCTVLVRTIALLSQKQIMPLKVKL